MTHRELDAEICCAWSRLCFIEWTQEISGKHDADLELEARACRTALQVAETYRARLFDPAT